MRIADAIRGNSPAFSFEFFPPQTPRGEAKLLETVEALRPLNPAYVSVTYGAGGSTRDKTLELVTHIKHTIGIEAMAHLTCVAADRETIRGVLTQLRDQGIENVLPLRGDPPKDHAHFVRPENGFGYAAELVAFIREEAFPFCLAGAGYPEGHVECPDLDQDIQHLKHKVDCGLDVVITQLFFDNADFFAFVERARAAGITVPIIPGIMPITNVAQIERITSMCGARIPEELRRQMHAAADEADAVHAVGLAHATAQCRELLAQGAPGIHFYTLNQSTATREIVEAICT